MGGCGVCCVKMKTQTPCLQDRRTLLLLPLTRSLVSISVSLTRSLLLLLLLLLLLSMLTGQSVALFDRSSTAASAAATLLRRMLLHTPATAFSQICSLADGDSVCPNWLTFLLCPLLSSRSSAAAADASLHSSPSFMLPPLLPTTVSACFQHSFIMNGRRDGQLQHQEEGVRAGEARVRGKERQ